MNKPDKILLIYPKFPHSLSGLNIPMSLMYLGSYLLSKGFAVRIIDANNISNQELIEQIKIELPDTLAVGISAKSHQVPSGVDIARTVRSIAPKVPVIWGGIHPSLFPEQVARSPLADYVVYGEGEETATELLSEISIGNLRPSNVKGIAYAADASRKEIIVTPPRGFLDMDQLPPVRWELVFGVTREKDIREIARLTGRGLDVQTSRGCPWHCTFCINSVLKTGVRYRKMDLVMEDIKAITDMGVSQIFFLDDEFFTVRKRVREFAIRVKEDGLNFKWKAAVRANLFNDNYLNPEFLSELKMIGLERLAIGAESGSDKILKKLKKQITVDDTLRAADFTAKAGIQCDFSFILGLPDEDAQDIAASLNLIDRIIRKDKANLFNIQGPQIYRPYPGSALFEECLKYGMEVPCTLEGWAGDIPYLTPDGPDARDPAFYPWVQTPMDYLIQVAFYGWLSGIRLKSATLSRLVRGIAGWRCRHSFYAFPAEMKLAHFVIGTKAAKLLYG